MAQTGSGARFCVICGKAVQKNAAACPDCGAPYDGEARFRGQNPYGAGGIGYSDRAGDKSFRRNRRRALIGTLAAMLVISVLIIGFLLISGQLSPDAKGWKIIGGIMAILWGFWIIWLLVSSAPHRGWEGVVEQKYRKLHEYQRHSESRGHYTERSTEFTVVFRLPSGKTKKCTQYNSSSWYDYLSEGDRVLYHGKGMEYYEKYDKSRDTAIPCASCGSLRDARENYCGHCGAVILKGQPVYAPPGPGTAQTAPEYTQPAPGAAPYPTGPVQAPVRNQNPTAFCPSCGAPTSGGKFCPGCGRKLT